MPKVGKKMFPYTKSGKTAAKKASKKMGIPMMKGIIKKGKKK